MQQSGSMFPVMQSFPPTSISTEQIQKYLDENKKLILAILDNQNLGKVAECAQYQAQLQKNLMYLASIADAQPQPSVIPTQLTPHPGMQQGSSYLMQHPHQLQGSQQPLRSGQNDVIRGDSGRGIPKSNSGPTDEIDKLGSAAPATSVGRRVEEAGKEK